MGSALVVAREFLAGRRAVISGGDVLTSGPGKKVGIYVAEDQRYHGNAAYAAILDFLFFHGVSGATVTRGIAGFGADHHLHTTRLVDLAPRLPVKVEFIAT